jgi:hypothetical protein
VRIVNTTPKLTSLTFVVDSDAECFLPSSALRILKMDMTVMVHDLLVNMWLDVLLRMNDGPMRATCRVAARSLTMT